MKDGGAMEIGRRELMLPYPRAEVDPKRAASQRECTIQKFCTWIFDAKKQGLFRDRCPAVTVKHFLTRRLPRRTLSLEPIANMRGAVYIH
jgi:hypothetical protein